MPGSETPESVVQVALEAAAARRWEAVFHLIDKSDLPRWRRVTLSMLRHLETQPNAERIFAEWGARDTTGLEPLQDAELFARWIHAFSLEARARMLSEEPGAPPPSIRRVVLGSVQEGEDMAHVLYREMVRDGSALRITTLRRTSGGWKLKVDQDLFGAASFHFGPPQPPPPSAHAED